MRVACIMMQKDEDDLLGPWVAHHAYLFGFQNLYVLDNGSRNQRTIEQLAAFERLGVRVDRSFPSREDYNRKGELIGDVIRRLDGTGAFDFFLPSDCDEFLALRVPWGFTCRKEPILAYLATLQGETRALRIPYQIANNPYEQDFYTYFTFHKTFFARGTFDYLDHGHHSGRTKGNPGTRNVALAHIHFHCPAHAKLAARAHNKWYAPVSANEALADPSYQGSSAHLIPHFSTSEDEYRASRMDGVQFYVPALREQVQTLGHSLLWPPEATSGDIENRPLLPLAEKLMGPYDRMDLGPLTRTAMFVPPLAESGQWTKVYFEETDYLRRHADVRAVPNLSALYHFCRHGYKEPGRVRSIRDTGSVVPSFSGDPAIAALMGLFFKV